MVFVDTKIFPKYFTVVLLQISAPNGNPTGLWGESFKIYFTGPFTNKTKTSSLSECKSGRRF